MHGCDADLLLAASEIGRPNVLFVSAGEAVCDFP